MVIVDENTYLALVKSEIVGKGRINCNCYAKFKDEQWPEELRKEYVMIGTEMVTI